MRKLIASATIALAMIAGNATAANAVGNWPF